LTEIGTAFVPLVALGCALAVLVPLLPPDEPPELLPPPDDPPELELLELLSPPPPQAASISASKSAPNQREKEDTEAPEVETRMQDSPVAY
jgi:hypothetical protein